MSFVSSAFVRFAFGTVLVGGRLYLRDQDVLLCYRAKP
jgi:hypothetical protein